MLGSLTDAEDIVQEAWMRWNRTDPTAVDNPGVWLTTVTTRLALDRMRTIERRREDYIGPWLPEPVAMERGPEAAAEVADSLTLGFLVLLDRLTPVERAVFLLADVFGEPFADIAAAVGKTDENCRQIATRARRKLRDEHLDDVKPVGEHTLTALLMAIASGDVNEVLALLHTDVTLVSDGGASRHAAWRVVVGPERVARLLINVGQRVLRGEKQGYAMRGEPRFVTVNGAAALLADLPDGPYVFTADERDGLIVKILTLLNPDKLGHLEDVPEMR